MDRREFIKATAASAAAATLGVNLWPGPGKAEAANGTTWHKSVCRFCGVGCGVMVGVKDGKVIGVKGDKENTINRGFVCVKGFYLHKVVTAKNRLLHPLIRKNGKLQQASWDEAMDLVASKFRETIDKYGPDAVAFYGSGQAETEETYIANKLFKGHIGTNNLEGNPRLCMASAVGGYLTSFGSDEPVGSYDDLDTAELFLIIGSNTAECHP
ncbi:MAG: twin-arginine translocation signal domain-containing protein, partial [Calditrichaeota bacterium]